MFMQCKKISENGISYFGGSVNKYLLKAANYKDTIETPIGIINLVRT